MKYPFLVLFVCLSLLAAKNLNAQAPQGINYQAIARDATGNPMANKAISIKISIVEGTAEGTTAYAERHNVTTNQLGLFQLSIGSGTALTSDFTKINWSTGNKFVRVEVDINGGTNYILLGTQQLLSVPYALYAEKSGQSSVAGEGIKIEQNIISNTAPDRPISLTGAGATTISGTYPNFTIRSIDKVNDADSVATNELQTLALAGNNLTLSHGGGTVALPSTGSQWTTSGNNIYYNRGNVGIGSIQPIHKLHVNGHMKIGGDEGIGSLNGLPFTLATSSRALWFGTHNDIGKTQKISDYGVIYGEGNATTETYRLNILTGDNATSNPPADGGNDEVFIGNVNFNEGIKKGMLIKNGQVGIGTEIPSSQLHLNNGNILLTGQQDKYVFFGDTFPISGQTEAEMQAKGPMGRFIKNSIGTDNLWFNGAEMTFHTYENSPAYPGWIRYYYNQSNNITFNMRDTRIGLGSADPKSAIHVTNGDIYLENSANGVIMKSPNGACWRMTVSDNGTPVFTSVACP